MPCRSTPLWPMRCSRPEANGLDRPANTLEFAVSAMAKGVVRQHAGHHCLPNRHGANPDAGVEASGGRALAEGTIAGAGLDVYEREPQVQPEAGAGRALPPEGYAEALSRHPQLSRDGRASVRRHSSA